jgi:hypothetical protein
MVKSLAKEQGVGLKIVQKDYAISYLLAVIAQTTGLGETKELFLSIENEPTLT